ncbi:MAG: type VI secretion system contractile sheath large subunit, partial [Pseudomonas sp.]|nr:type VI secretion system contractile sheath large subunit [Pseudomonas sp.]
MSTTNNTTTTADTTTETIGNSTLLDQIMVETMLVPSQEGYQIARQGVAAFISEMLKTDDPDQLVNKHRVDQMIAEVDRL